MSRLTFGMVLVRCQVCEDLNFDPRTGECNGCGWEGDCSVCGDPLAHPTEGQHCSDSCRHVALDEIHAELGLDR